MRCKVDKSLTVNSMVQNHVDISKNAHFPEMRPRIAVDLVRQFHRSIKAVEKL
jgi:hypothetical protein